MLHEHLGPGTGDLAYVRTCNLSHCCSLYAGVTAVIYLEWWVHQGATRWRKPPWFVHGQGYMTACVRWLHGKASTCGHVFCLATSAPTMPSAEMNRA